MCFPTAASRCVRAVARGSHERHDLSAAYGKVIAVADGCVNCAAAAKASVPHRRPARPGPQRSLRSEAESSGVPALPNVKTACSWRGIVRYAPRTGGAHDSHHRTAGIAGRTRRRGNRVAARGARAATASDAACRVCRHSTPEGACLYQFSQANGRAGLSRRPQLHI
jgi:hypothetical protein